MINSHSPNHLSEEEIPKDLGTLRVSGQTFIFSLFVGVIPSIILYFQIIEIYNEGFKSEHLMALPMISFPVIYTILLFANRFRIKNGVIKTLFSSVRYDEIVMFYVETKTYKGNELRILTFTSAHGKVVKISEEFIHPDDWEKANEWGQNFFQPGSPWLEQNFEIIAQRYPDLTHFE